MIGISVCKIVYMRCFVVAIEWRLYEYVCVDCDSRAHKLFGITAWSEHCELSISYRQNIFAVFHSQAKRFDQNHHLQVMSASASSKTIIS